MLQQLELKIGKRLPQRPLYEIITGVNNGYSLDSNGDIIGLNLVNTHVEDISFLSSLTGLENLFLSFNQVSDVSPLAPLTALKILDLSSNRLTDISPLAGLNALTRLSLSSNQLTDLSPLAGLNALTRLSLSSNQLTDLSPLAGLTALTRLSLSSNQLTDLSPLAPLTALTSLELNNNQITDLSPLAGLTALTVLILYNNQITDLSPLAGLRQLQNLDLSNNNISQLPEAIVHLHPGLEIKWEYEPYKDALILEGNPLETPPVEVVKQGTNAVRNYFKELEKESVSLLQCKLLIVGNGEVGKTTLMKKLIDNNFGVEWGKEETTHGIHIQPWPLKIQFKDRGKTTAPETVNLVFWDFGGQDIYHATHQFFLTKRSLYLFVWEVRREEETRSFDYWLNIVKLLGADSPVIMVMNKADIRTKHIDEAGFKSKFPNIQAFCKISCLTNEGIPELIEEIRSNLSRMPHLRDKLPRVWAQIRDRLEQEKKKKNYIRQEEYFSICLEYSLNLEHAQFVSEYLHDMGVILHYRTDPLLQHTVILNPEWATEAVYKLIDTREIQENNGSFKFEDLKRYWDAKKYPHDKHPELVRLMEKFELCFNFTGTDLHFVPELQPPANSKMSEPFYKSVPTPPKIFDKSDKQKLLEVQEPFHEKVPGRLLRFQYHYDFMPEGIVSRFMARMFYLIYENRFWKNRVELKFEDSFAHVAGEPLNRRIAISITGSRQRELLAIIRSHFDAIHSTLNMEKNLHYHEMVPCICPKCLESETPNFYQYEKLKIAFEKNLTHIPCLESFEEVSIEEMLALVAPPKPEHDLKETLIMAVSQLQGLAGTIRLDEDSRNGFIALLLNVQGYIVKDQTRWGRSASGKDVGVVDIKVENRDGQTSSIIEAFNLQGFNKTIIKSHLDKLFSYDAQGLDRNFILIYAEAMDFLKLWRAYLDYLPQIDYKYKAMGGPQELNTPFAGIKAALMRHERDGKETQVYHLFVKMVH